MPLNKSCVDVVLLICCRFCKCYPFISCSCLCYDNDIICFVLGLLSFLASFCLFDDFVAQGSSKSSN